MLKLVKKNLGVVRAAPPTLLGSSTAVPRPPSWWGLLPLPKNPTPLSAFGIFWPFGPHWAAKVFIPPMRKGRLITAHFSEPKNALECRSLIVLKIYQKKSGPPRPEGRHLFASTPCPPAECWCPSASSRLATRPCCELMSRDSMFLSYLPPYVCSATLMLITCCQTVAM